MRVGREGQVRSPRVSYQCLVFHKGILWNRYHQNFDSIETGINLYVHTRTMKILLFTIDSPLRASARHGGAGTFFEFCFPIRCTGSPLGGGGNHRV